MFRNIVAVGNDIARCGTLHVGSILINDMTLAGTKFYLMCYWLKLTIPMGPLPKP